MNKLGIDIGGTFIKYALVDDSYKIVDKWKVEIVKFKTKDELYDYISSNMRNIDDIELIGISAPGIIDEQANFRSYAAPNIRIMYGTNIVYEIQKRTNKKVFAINDAKAAGLCEFEIGNAKNSKSSAFLILGTGTGGCICNENGVIYGKDSFAGEFHKLPFINFSTGKIDEMGDYSSMTALIKIYNDKVNENKKVKYGHEVCNKYLEKDIIATEAVDQWIGNIIVQLITITFLGIGLSGVLCKYAARYFSAVGKFTFHIDDPFFPKNFKCYGEILIIALSVSGETPTTIENIVRFKKENCAIASITNTENCSIAKLSDLNLPYYVQQVKVNYSDITTQIPVLYMIERIGKKLYNEYGIS